MSKKTQLVQVEMPAAMVEWLNEQAGEIESRSSFLRRLVALAMEGKTP